MATDTSRTMLTAGKLADALGVSQGKVKKMMTELGIKPDEIQRGCNYYGTATLGRLKTELKKQGK